MNTHRQINNERRADMSRSARSQDRSSSRPRAVLLTGLVTLVFLLIHFFHGPRPVTPNQAAESSAATPPPAAAGSAVPGTTRVTLGLRPGDRLIYDYRQEHTIEIQGSGFAGINKGATNQSVSMHTAQTGELAVNVYDENDKGWTVGFSLENARLRMSSGERVAPPDGSEAGLRAEILAFVEKSGRIVRMTAQTNTSAEVLNHWRDILSRWQTILESDPSTLSWKRNEQDATGSYVAAYYRESKDTPTSLRKQKERYASISNVAQKNFETRFKVSGTATIRLNPYPISITGNEHMTVETPEIGGSIEAQVEYSFQLRTAAQDPGVVAQQAEMVHRLEHSAASFGWTPVVSPRQQGSDVDVSNTTIEEQMANLEQLLAAGKGGTPAEVKVLGKIVALIEKDDAAVDAIINRLRAPNASPNHELGSALLGMLGAAGTPKAQETLVGLVNTPDWPLEQRQTAIFSFAQVTEPIPQVDGWLQQLHRDKGDLADNSLLILAAMGDRVRERDPERFSQISSYVIGAASAPNLAVEEKIVALDAIANLGPEEVPQAVRNALADENPLVREKAVLSLKRMDADTTYSLIGYALQADPDTGVRAAAAASLGDSRQVNGFNDLCRAVTSDPSEDVRSTAIQSLGKWVNTNPEAARILERVAAQDVSQDVRNAANQVLHSHEAFQVAEAGATAR